MNPAISDRITTTDALLPHDTNFDVTEWDYIHRPKKFRARHPDKFSDNQVDWLIRNRKKNGLEESGAVLFLSGKAYLHEKKFLLWFLARTTFRSES